MPRRIPTAILALATAFSLAGPACVVDDDDDEPTIVDGEDDDDEDVDIDVDTSP